MTIEELNEICKGTYVDLLNIKFIATSDTEVDAVMNISPDLLQPMGVVHGGALISLAETVGSAGSALLVDPEKFNVLGSVVNSQHLAPAKEGMLHAKARIIVENDYKHVWDVEIRDDEDKLISISRVTNSIKPRKEEADQ